MGRINWGRVFVGAVLWWLVVMVLGIPGWLLYGEDWSVTMGAYGQQFPNAELIVVFNVGVLVLGFLATWLYAAIRPRYGPGAKTAMIAGLAVWLTLSVASTFWGEMQMRFVSRRMVALAIAAYLVIIVVATIAGAWPYKEAG